MFFGDKHFGIYFAGPSWIYFTFSHHIYMLMLIKWITALGAVALTLRCFVDQILTLQICSELWQDLWLTQFRLKICEICNCAQHSNNGDDLFLFNRSLFTKSKAFVMKIIFSRLVKDSSKCETEVNFPVRSKLYIEKTGSFLAFGLSEEK